MTADFAFNWNSILNVLKTFGISDFFDIIIVAFLVYKVLSFASNSRAGQLIKGICLLFVLYFIASEFTLKSTSYLLEQVFSFGMIAIIVVFQPELRHALESMGKSKISNLNFFNFTGEHMDEEALMKEGIEIRHIAQGRNVPMFKTNIQTVPVGPFSGPMVCSMRPMTPENAKKAYDITFQMPNVHGAPVHMGDPKEVGVEDVMKPDYGEAVDIYEGEIPVFWPCGVTPQAAVENAKPPIVITHAPGHMFITDILNAELNDYLEKKKKGE